MLNRFRFVRVGLAAVLVLALGVGSASAARGFAISEALNITATARAMSFGPAESPIVCEVVRRISLHRSVTKTAGNLLGFVTEATARNCRGGLVRMLSETLPWHIVYLSFSGTLPNATRAQVMIREIAWLEEYNSGLSRCLWVGEVPGEANITTRRIRTFSYGGVARLRGTTLSVLPCPETSHLSGTLTMLPEPSINLM